MRNKFRVLITASAVMFGQLFVDASASNVDSRSLSQFDVLHQKPLPRKDHLSQDWPPNMIQILSNKLGAGKPTALPKLGENLVSQTLAGDSYMVFQSQRDGNWEIYRADGNGQNALRLTVNITDDIEASLSPNGSQIVFTSRRDGNYEIYIMSSNGSSIRRLTTNAAIDAQPAWSPDSNQIAFVSDRSGSPQIFKMNSDGSGLIQLTNNEAFNLYPTWSVFGNTIAWVLGYPNATFRYLQVMRADGTDQHFLFIECAFIRHPHWSPDGKHMAFDCDMDNDNWNELVIADTQHVNYGLLWFEDGLTNPHVVFDPGNTLIDARLESWAPDGQTLLISQEIWRQVDTVYRLIGYGTYSLVPHSGGITKLSTQTDLDRSFDWRWHDQTAPNSRIRRLPEYTRTYNGSYIVITWDGQDIGSAGILGYDLQYRLDNNAWVDWLIATTDTPQSLIAGEPGQTLYFRSRARDTAGNIELWPADPGDTSTRLFQTIISGTVKDIRGVAIPNASVTISSTLFSEQAGTANIGGFYILHITNPRDFRMRFNGSGYIGSPNTYIDTYDNIQLTFLDSTFLPYLYPKDNVVINSSLEDGELMPTGWQWDGTIGPFTLPGQFLGGRSVSYYPAFSNCASRCLSQRVSIPETMHEPTLAFAYKSKFGISPAGSAFAVSITDDVTTTRIFTGQQIDSNWIQAWVDMKPWAGKSITISVGATNNSETGQMFVDDIALGSWTTPLISNTELFTNSLSVGGQIIVTGSNFIATPTLMLNNMIPLTDVQWVNSETIKVSIQDSLSPGIYDLWVTNPSGARGVLPSALRIGRQFFLPLMMI